MISAALCKRIHYFTFSTQDEFDLHELFGYNIIILY